SEAAADAVVTISTPKAGKGPIPGVGDRVLARVFPSEEGDGAYAGRVIRILEKRREAVLGLFRVLQDGSFRIDPVERGKPELVVDEAFRNGAKDGDLVEAEPVSLGRYGLPRAKVLTIVGSLASEKAVSMIAIHAHEIPHIFPPEVLAEAGSVEPVSLSGLEDWRTLPLVTIDPPDAKDHDDAVYA